jgi:hypothetical protein
MAQKCEGVKMNTKPNKSQPQMPEGNVDQQENAMANLHESHNHPHPEVGDAEPRKVRLDAQSQTTVESREAISAQGDFDLDALRLSQNFPEMAGVQKLLTTVPVRKPHRQEFVRVHPDPSWRLETAILEVQDDQGKTVYLVDPALWPELAGEIAPMTLLAAINRQGVPFLWPVRLPGEDGRHNEWHRSAYEAAQHAMDTWVRVASNRALGAYDVFVASGAIPDPVWPQEGFAQLVRIAFRDKFIREWDHPALRQLRGEI